jgi:hypothetical protein
MVLRYVCGWSYLQATLQAEKNTKLHKQIFVHKEGLGIGEEQDGSE